MTHAADAARLAKKLEEENPAAAGLIYAVLAVAETGFSGDGWRMLNDFEDLPWQLEQEYVFEYQDGEQVKWRLSADNASSVHTFYSPEDKALWVDPNDLVDQCARWRWA